VAGFQKLKTLTLTRIAAVAVHLESDYTTDLESNAPARYDLVLQYDDGSLRTVHGRLDEILPPDYVKDWSIVPELIRSAVDAVML